MAISQSEIEQFLYREARYLDDREFDKWLECYAPDSEFWMPAWDDDDKLTQDPQNEVSLIWYGDKSGLEDRVFVITHPLIDAKISINSAAWWDGGFFNQAVDPSPFDRSSASGQ